MRYAYHFEFCERPELPAWFRGDLLCSLAWMQNLFGLARILEHDVPELLAECGARRCVELGSGSGEGLARVATALRSPLECVATDKFPQHALWRARLSSLPNARAIEWPVTFEDFDSRLEAGLLDGAALLFVTAFHHLPGDRARSFLERAAARGAHVLVIEPLHRTFAQALLGALAGWPTVLFPLLARGLGPALRLRAALLHWVFPIIPLFIGHDGVVSALRQRTRAEWDMLTAGLPYSCRARERLGLFGSFSAVLLRHHGGLGPF